MEFLLATTLSTVLANSQPDSEKVNRFCAYLVDIPYGSDNFTDAKYERFLVCKELFE